MPPPPHAHERKCDTSPLHRSLCDGCHANTIVFVLSDHYPYYKLLSPLYCNTCCCTLQCTCSIENWVIVHHCTFWHLTKRLHLHSGYKLLRNSCSRIYILYLNKVHLSSLLWHKTDLVVFVSFVFLYLYKVQLSNFVEVCCDTAQLPRSVINCPALSDNALHWTMDCVI